MSAETEWEGISRKGYILKALWRVRRKVEEAIRWELADVYYPKTILKNGRCLIADCWVADSKTYLLVGLLGKEELAKFSFFSAYKLCVHTEYAALVQFSTALANVEFLYEHKLSRLQPNTTLLSPTVNSSILASTTCRDDYRLLRRWVKYHSQLGIRSYCIYYNGRIPLNLYRITKPIRIQVRLIQWELPYFFPNNGDPRPDWHHGQLIQLIHALWRCCKPHHEWIANFDLDEYIVLERETLADLLVQNPVAVAFPNVWHEKGDRSVSRGDHLWRAKQISRTSEFDSFWVHQTPSFSGERPSIAGSGYLAHHYQLGAPWRVLKGHRTSIQDEIKRAHSSSNSSLATV
jgi:hypothetical protein